MKPIQTKAARFRDLVYEGWERQSDAALHARREAAQHPLIARMTEVQTRGRYDKDANGFNRCYAGQIGGRLMSAQVVEEGGDLVIGFWGAAVGDNHHRRLLVTRDAEMWLEVDETAVKHFGKYAAAAVTILARRAFERDRAALAA